ncbi:MAG: RecQ family ATP-dependent DNA helicase [Elusimicrobia bacterium]|nr:RecQ family ATP-dependent DNA helicase [Elusimicrobiota bacterium]
MAGSFGWIHVYKLLNSGYVLGTVLDALRRGSGSTDAWWDDIWRHLTTFTLEADFRVKPTTPATCAVLSNIIARGLPTLASPEVEESLSRSTGWADQSDDDLGAIRFQRTPNPGIEANLARALLVVDPSLRAGERPRIPLPGCPGFGGVKSEVEFLQQAAPKLLGGAAWQCLCPHRAISDILPGDVAQPFIDQRCDFILELPAYEGNPRAVVFGIDDISHQAQAQRLLDDARDAALLKAGIETIRIPESDVRSVPPAGAAILAKLSAHPYIKGVNANGSGELLGSAEGKAALHLALAPLAIARIHSALVEAIRHGVLSLEAYSWRLAVVERDVACARLAVADFERLLGNLLKLQDARARVPRIDLTVIGNPDFRLEGAAADSWLPDVPSIEADLLIDVGVMQRYGFTDAVEWALKIHAPAAITLRSAPHPARVRRVCCERSPEYGKDDLDREALAYFLRLLFRKREFRPGQVDLVTRALRLQNAIALLPSGHGKSLAYQLPALLHPGITLVIDPLKSLMEDQRQGLRALGVDSACFIDSSMDGPARKLVSDQMREGLHQFVFISPERLASGEFRQHLERMAERKFALCVIDEAHCVSEWGHDFRTAYLRLGDNLRRCCRARNASLPILALTGTASYDVLSDVMAELRISEDAVIRPQDFKRPELRFEVIPVKIPEGATASRDVAQARRAELTRWMAQVLSAAGEPDCGIVFTPAGAFADKDIAAVQAAFKQDAKRILFASKESGIGIDKPNVRFTAHLSMPASLESLYQEAGRAGRDRKDAACAVLYSDLPGLDKELLLRFHQDLFRGEAVEWAMLEDLLYGNGYVTSELDSLAIELERRAGQEVRLALWSQDDSNRLYVNSPDGQVSYGYIDLDAGVAEAACGQDSRLLKETNTLLEERVPVGIPAVQFLARTRPPAPGLAAVLDRLRGGQEEAWTVALENDWKVMRRESDTFRAVYRLSVVGCVDEYEIDYHSRTIRVVLKKRPEQEYVAALGRYAARWVSKEDADALMRQVKADSRGKPLEDALRGLLRFVYQRVAKKRLAAIDAMESAVRAALAGQDFAEYVNTIFDSKFTPLLRPCMRKHDMKVLWDLIDRVDGSLDELNHLRGACDRLLQEDTDNAAFVLLRAYARVLLPKFDRAQALSDFRKGWESVRARTPERADWLPSLARFIVLAADHDPESAPVLAPELIGAHGEWVADFLKRFNGGTDGGHTADQ